MIHFKTTQGGFVISSSKLTRVRWSWVCFFLNPKKWAESWLCKRAESALLVFFPGRCFPCPQCLCWMITSATIPSWRIPQDSWMPTWTSSTPSEPLQLSSHSFFRVRLWGDRKKKFIFLFHIQHCAHTLILGCQTEWNPWRIGKMRGKAGCWQLFQPCTPLLAQLHSLFREAEV